MVRTPKRAALSALASRRAALLCAGDAEIEVISKSR